MFEDRKIAARQAEIKRLSDRVDELLKANASAGQEGSVRSTEELLAAGKRLDEITDLNLKITKLRREVNKLEDKKLIKNHILKRD